MIGDPSSAPGDPISPGQLVMTMASYLDSNVKLKATLGQNQGDVDGYIQLTVMGPGGQPILVRVSHDYAEQVDQLSSGDSFVAVGRLGSTGDESNPQLAIVVD